MHAPAPAPSHHPAPELASADRPAPAGQAPQAPEPAPADVPAPAEGEITVSRTLVKSHPELSEMIASDGRFDDGRLTVSMVERGFGTMVTLSAAPDAGITETELTEALAQLSEPQRRPFNAT